MDNKTYYLTNIGITNTVIIDNPCEKLPELIVFFIGFLYGFNIEDNIAIIQFFDEIPSDKDIIEDFVRELNVLGYELKKEN